MANISTLKEAEQLLGDIKARIRKSGLLFMNTRDKNAQALADLGITEPTQRRIINDLEGRDYYKGPDPDEKYAGKVIVVFGAE